MHLPNFLPKSIRKIILGEVVVEGGIGFWGTANSAKECLFAFTNMKQNMCYTQPRHTYMQDVEPHN